MHRLWHAIGPLLDAARAARVLEIGTSTGATTRLLVARAARSSGFVHSIDTEPSIDAAMLATEADARLVLHHGASLDVLPTLSGFDAVLVDGDHNWHTVSGELAATEALAVRQGAFPLVLLHDVGWPYGRRDMYYDPSRIPDRDRHPALRSGVMPGREQLEHVGINTHLPNAIHEGGERNGVLTAVEDFLRGREDLVFRVLHGFHGLGILAHRSLLSGRPVFTALFDMLCNPRTADHIERLESARVEEHAMRFTAEVRSADLEKELVAMTRRYEAEVVIRTNMERTRSWRWTAALRRIFTGLRARSPEQTPGTTPRPRAATPAVVPHRDVRSGRIPTPVR